MSPIDRRHGPSATIGTTLDAAGGFAAVALATNDYQMMITLHELWISNDPELLPTLLQSLRTGIVEML
jgi:hypothetical protein